MQDRRSQSGTSVLLRGCVTGLKLIVGVWTSRGSMHTHTYMKTYILNTYLSLYIYIYTRALTIRGV